jgi:hypothetical protein
VSKIFARMGSRSVIVGRQQADAADPGIRVCPAAAGCFRGSPRFAAECTRGVRCPRPVRPEHSQRAPIAPLTCKRRISFRVAPRLRRPQTASPPDCVAPRLRRPAPAAPAPVYAGPGLRRPRESASSGQPVPGHSRPVPGHSRPVPGHSRPVPGHSRPVGPRFVLALILVACKRLFRRFSNKNQRKDDPPPRSPASIARTFPAGTGQRVGGHAAGAGTSEQPQPAQARRLSSQMWDRTWVFQSVIPVRFGVRPDKSGCNSTQSHILER